MSRLDLLPNLVIPGVPKAGTSSLFWYLSQHPDICAADRKEVNHFRSLRYGQEPPGPLEDYARHFGHCGGRTYRMDASPAYVYGGRRVVEALHEHLPDPRIVFILREPVGRLWSSYVSLKERGKLRSSVGFRTYFEESRRLYDSGRDHLPEHKQSRGLAIGRYIDVLCDWFEVFDDRVNVVFFEHLAGDPRGVVARLCGWLGLDDSLAEGFDYSLRNKTVQPRSRAVAKLVRAINLRVDRGTRLPPRAKAALRSAYGVLNATKRHEELSLRDRATTEEFYAPANRALRKELAQRGYGDLPEWVTSA